MDCADPIDDEFTSCEVCGADVKKKNLKKHGRKHTQARGTRKKKLRRGRNRPALPAGQFEINSDPEKARKAAQEYRKIGARKVAELDALHAAKNYKQNLGIEHSPRHIQKCKSCGRPAMTDDEICYDCASE